MSRTGMGLALFLSVCVAAVGVSFGATPATQPTSRELIAEAIGLFGAGADAKVPNGILMSVSRLQAKMGDVAAARQTADRCAEPYRGTAYCQIALALANGGDVTGALTAAGQSGYPSTGYDAIARALADKGDVAGVKAAVAKVSAPNLKAVTDVSLARAMAVAGDCKGALQVAGAIGDGGIKVEALCQVAVEQFRQKDIAGARDTIARAQQALPNNFLKGRALAKIAEAQVKLGDLAGAMKSADGAVDPIDRGIVYRRIAITLAEAGDSAGAKATVAKMGDDHPDDLIEVYTKLAIAEAVARDGAGARTSLDTANALLRKVDPDLRSNPRAEIAAAQAKIGDVAGALEYARSATDPQEKALALLTVADALPAPPKP